MGVYHICPLCGRREWQEEGTNPSTPCHGCRSAHQSLLDAIRTVTAMRDESLVTEVRKGPSGEEEDPPVRFVPRPREEDHGRKRGD